MIVVAYIRVSSASQSLAMQRDAIKRCAETRGDQIDRWIAERRSVTSRRRPGSASKLDEVHQLATSGQLRRLYVYRLDRLTRTGIRDTLAQLADLRDAGVELVTVADGFDPGGPAAELVGAVMGWAAQMETVALRERISDARRRVEASGGSWGRPRALSDHQVEQVRKLRRQLDLSGRAMSIRAIAARLKVPKTQVQLVLARKGCYDDREAVATSRLRRRAKGRG
jgi:DNA invertase Pin-like site-specific DNA recombinase